VVGRDRAVNAMRVSGVQQVQLDCVIAQVSRTELRNMNFDFLQQGGSHTINSSVGGGDQHLQLHPETPPARITFNKRVRQVRTGNKTTSSSPC